MLKIELQGESLFLHHEKAIYWHASRTLIVADTHFGKDAVFRQHAIPIPTGSVCHDLKRLEKLIADTEAERLLVLGDFIHGAMGIEEPFIKEFKQWRKQHESLIIDVVLGNHDRRINTALYDNVNWHDELQEGPFFFTHEPCSRTDNYVLSGHIHPVVRLSAGRGDSMRLPVFWLQERQGTLPSFGSMTGGYTIKPGQNERVYAVGPDAVMPVN